MQLRFRERESFKSWIELTEMCFSRLGFKIKSLLYNYNVKKLFQN